MNLEANITKYLNGGADSDGREPDARYASFDYCFNYFQAFRQSGNLKAIADARNIQLSCLSLGFYLASWGMLRGSAELLQKSARHLKPAVELIADTSPEVWEIDAHRYTDQNIQRLLDIGRSFQRIYPGMSDILVTKIMLGVFGNVPAFDTYFKNGCQVSTFGRKALQKIGAFYKDNHEVIDRFRTPTLDFVTGKPTPHRYTRAKVIDMAFFVEGMSLKAAQPAAPSPKLPAVRNVSPGSGARRTGMQIFNLRLQPTYFEQGFFNVAVDFDRYVRKAEGPIPIQLGERGLVVEGKINRRVNNNGTARILGGARLKRWFQANFEPMDTVAVDLTSEDLIVLEKK